MKILHLMFVSLVLFGCSQNPIKETTHYDFPFQNPGLIQEERIKDLISRLTLEEKTSLMLYNSPAIERLGIPEYNWWNECLH